MGVNTIYAFIRCYSKTNMARLARFSPMMTGLNRSWGRRLNLFRRRLIDLCMLDKETEIGNEKKWGLGVGLVGGG